MNLLLKTVKVVQSPGSSLHGILHASNSLATSWEELTRWKRPWCWEGVGAGGEGDDRGWDSWMASPAQWTWVWVNSGSWWWTERPGVLRFTGLQSRTRLSDWTELNWTIHSLLQGIFLTQGSNLGLLHCRWIPYCVSHQEKAHHSLEQRKVL